MKADTKTITIDREPQVVFAYVANAEHLPIWAKGFARSIRRHGERWLVTTPHGEELTVRYVTDPALGVVDYHISPAPGVEFLVASRVVPNAAGAEYILTQFQLPSMPDDVFEGQVRTLTQELAILKHTVEVSCPVHYASIV